MGFTGVAKDKINLVGAFDRHNYGDILFAMIHARVIKEECRDVDIRYASIISTNKMVKFGGFTTCTVDEIDSTEKTIVVGGEVLSVGWVGAIGNHGSSIYFDVLRVIQKILGFEVVNQLIKSIYQRKNKFPYVMPGDKVFYTGVSGTKFKNKKHILDVCRVLSEARSISVRDNVTLKKIQDYLPQSSFKLSPDTALIMSDVFSNSELESSGWANHTRSDNCFDFGNYIVFQIAKTYAVGALNKIFMQLKSASEANGFGIYLVPIGRATGHEDHIPLENIFHKLSKAGVPVSLLDSSNVLSIMNVISKSKLYAGTSLHGAITAYSFEIKVCAVVSFKVPKLSAYLETWVDKKDYILNSDVGLLCKEVSVLTKDREFYSEAMLLEQKEKVYSDIKNYIDA